MVNSLHNEGVDRLAPGLSIEATAPDGTVEAVRVTEAPGWTLGLQWHPESDAEIDAASRAIFSAFGEAVRSRVAADAAVLHGLDHLLREYGAGLVGVTVGLEAMGLPLPGESMVIGAAIYCATTHQLSIVTVLAAAAAGAVLGDNAGYLIGRSIGFRVLARYGRRIGLSEDRLLLGRHLFRRYGGSVVFVGRFVAVLRTFVALLAGANRMGWGRFLLWNAAGGRRLDRGLRNRGLSRRRGDPPRRRTCRSGDRRDRGSDGDRRRGDGQATRGAADRRRETRRRSPILKARWFAEVRPRRRKGAQRRENARVRSLTFLWPRLLLRVSCKSLNDYAESGTKT